MEVSWAVRQILTRLELRIPKVSDDTYYACLKKDVLIKDEWTHQIRKEVVLVIFHYYNKTLETANLLYRGYLI